MTVEKFMFLFFKNPHLETIVEYLTDVWFFSLSEAKKDAAEVCRRIDALKAKGVELEYNSYWDSYQVHHQEIGLRVFDGRDPKEIVYLAEGL